MLRFTFSLAELIEGTMVVKTDALDGVLDAAGGVKPKVGVAG